MGKRVLGLMIATFLVFIIPIVAFAAEDSGTYQDINWSLDKAGNLVLDGGNVVPADGPWLNYKKEIKTIVVGDSFQSIESHAFRDLSNLTSVTLGKDLESMESEAFDTCKKLKTVKLLGEKTTINGKAFYSSTFSELILPEDSNYKIVDNCVLTKDGETMVYCLGGQNVIIPSGVKSIENGAFSCNKVTKTVSLPNTLTTIGEGAFSNCDNLTSIAIPASVNTLGQNAFWDCQSLKEVKFLGSNINIEGLWAFGFASKLKSVLLPAASFDKIDNDGHNSSTFMHCRNLETFVFSEGTEEIPGRFFDNCPKLKKVYVPASVKKINDSTFSRDSKGLVIMCVEGSYAEQFAKDNAYKYDYYVPMGSISLSETELELTNAKPAALSFTVEPATTTNKEVVWLSTDENVATVNNGKVTGVSSGECDIICRAQDGSNAQAVCHVAVKVDVRNIAINEKKIILLLGGSDDAATAKLTYQVSPEGAYWKDVDWSSSDEGIVTVDADGTIKGISAGKATITAVSKQPDSKAKAQAQVIVQQSVTAIELDVEETSIQAKKNVTIKATVLPEDAANKKLKWTSSDESVAKVSPQGKVTGVSSGEAIITVTADDGSETKAYCKVTVFVPVSKIQIEDGKQINLPFMMTRSLNVMVTPEDATIKGILWESSDPNVAIVDKNGLITARSSGDTLITATSTDGSNVVGSIKVHVLHIAVYDQTMYSWQGDNEIMPYITKLYCDESVDLNDVRIKGTSQMSAELYGDTVIAVAQKPGKAKVTVSYKDEKIDIDMITFAPKAIVRNGEYEYVVRQDGNAIITRFTGNDVRNELTIPAILDDHPVTDLGFGSFRGIKTKKINLPESIRRIGNNCFADSDLESISLSDGLEYVGIESFWNSKIQELNFGSSLNTIVYINDPNMEEVGAFAYYNAPNYGTEMTIDEDNPYYKTDGDRIIDIRNNQVIWKKN